MSDCMPVEFKRYIAEHLRDDAEHHRNMMTDDYRDSHSIMWAIIPWETWKKLMLVQSSYSEQAARLIDSMDICKE